MSPLLRHEALIAAAGMRLIVRRPVDLLTVAVLVPILLLIVRSWVASQPDTLLRLHAVGAGAVIASIAGGWLIERCAYHRGDGVLVADAQRPRERWAYALPLFAGAALLGLGGLMAVGIAHPLPWLAGTLLGAIAAFIASYIRGALRRWRPAVMQWLRPLRASVGRGISAQVIVGGALGLLCAMLPLSQSIAAVLAAGIALLGGVLLARVDAEAVRYRALVGHRVWGMIGGYLVPLTAFSAAFAAALIVSPYTAPAAAAAAVYMLVAIFTALRVLAYQCFAARMADWIVGGLLGIVAMLGYGFPPAAPLALVIGAAWLTRRANQRRWLLA